MMAAILVALLVALAVSLLLLWRRNMELVGTYSPIIDARAEASARAMEEAQRLRAEAMAELAEQHAFPTPSSRLAVLCPH